MREAEDDDPRVPIRANADVGAETRAGNTPVKSDAASNDDASTRQRDELRAIVENVPGFLVVSDRNGTIQYTSRLSPGITLVGANVFDLVRSEDQNGVREAFRKVEAGAPSARYDSVHIGPDGQTMVFESVLSAVRVDGQVERFVGFAQDVTEQRAQQREQRLLSAAAATAAECVFLTDVDQRILFVNRAFTAMTGFTLEECRGQVAIIFEPDRTSSDVCAQLENAIATREHFRGTVVKLRKDGGAFKADLGMGPVFDDAGVFVGFAGAYRDVAERDLEQQRLAHRRKMESIGTLAAGIAHELNTPAQFVGDNLSFLERAFISVQPILVDIRAFAFHAAHDHSSALTPADSHADVAERSVEMARLVARIVERARAVKMDYLLDEIPEALAQTREGVVRIARIVSATANFARPGEGVKEPIDVANFLKNIGMVCTGMWSHVASVSVRVAPGLPMLPAYVDELGQAIVNLVNNAGQAIETAVERGLKRKGQILLKAHATDEAIVITVSDDGSGMPASVRERAFEPFFTTRNLGKGLGEGLPYVHRVIVDNHHGEIDIDSVENVGTTITVTLPVGSVPLGG